MQGAEREFAIIDRPYLAVTNIPYFIDDSGRVLLDRAWRHDLVQHLRYLPAFTLAAPIRPLPADATDLVPLGEGLSAQLKLVPLSLPSSRIRALALLPGTVCALWRAIGNAEIVHTGIAGWPYPSGWLANPIAWLRGKKRLIIVESAPWRTNLGAHAPLRKRVEAAIHERLARYWCSRADLSFYTQPAYLEQFHGNGKGPAYVAPATWINAEDVLNDATARSLWEAKMGEPVRFLFAGRLVRDKGVRILLKAAKRLSNAGVRGALHVIGDGPLRDEVIAAESGGPFSLKYFEPVAYGEPFLRFLQNHHAVIIPSLSDEQPRIVFDAAACAVAILASETDGLRPHVEDSSTGRLVPPGDPDALAEVVASAAADPAALRSFAMEALARVRNKTHRAMHVERSRIIARHLLS